MTQFEQDIIWQMGLESLYAI